MKSQKIAGLRRSLFIAAIIAASACDPGTNPDGLIPAGDGEGPVVVFDLFHRPLPKVPIPTDVAGRPDPDSPTGMRLNISKVADTQLESDVRKRVDTLDGWGTFTPITVAFECDEDRDGICLDLDNIFARHHDRVASTGPHADEWPFQNDAVYVINLETGKPAAVDIGNGNYPKYVDRTGYYYPNDPRWDAPTIMFENENEQWGEDLDGDGHLDENEDIDGDGMLDDTEDLDGDGNFDRGTEDLDGDGHLDVAETDVDGDGRADRDEDVDGDGTLDSAEDADGDGTLDLVDEDVDGDGELDRDEDFNDNGVLDAGEDIDGDGHLDDEDEDFNRDGTLNVGEDLDGDGYLDTGEDVDHDENLDVVEDIDGDGHLDVDEDVDGDGNLDVLEDLDGDGRLDVAEDSDGDGHLDNIDEDLDGDGSFDTSAGSGEDLDGDHWLDLSEDVNGNGLLDGPADTNFDGVVGRANVWCPSTEYAAGRCHCRGGHECPTGLDPDSEQDMETLAWFLDPNWHTVPFYEFESNTLVIRPMVPLEPRTKYAVVLTDRLTGEDGQPVRSPFPNINHVDQTNDLAGLAGILLNNTHSYGGLGIGNVKFAWSFTTQSTYHDLVILRDGLYGNGPFSRLDEQFPPEVIMNRTWGCNPHAVDCELDPDLFRMGFVLPTEQLMNIVVRYAEDLFGLSAEEASAVLDMYGYVDYFVFGHIWSPNFLDGDGHDEFDDDWEDYRFQSEDLDFDGRLDVGEDTNFNGRLDEGEDLDGDGHLDNDEDRNGDGRLTIIDHDEGFWEINAEKGEGNYTHTWVPFFVAVPKQEFKITGQEDEPFPLVFYGHGYSSMMIEALGFAGSLAKFGLATAGVACVHHGLGEDEVFLSALQGVFQVENLTPLGEAILDDRARDMNNDGQKDSAADFWTAYMFHTRDVVRQSALDHYALIRAFRNFDGTNLAQPVDVDYDGTVDTTWDFEHMTPGTADVVGDYDGDGERELAGDFNADGKVDFGGPDTPYYAWGQSLGGIMSALMGGAEPAIKGIAPTSGGGGLSDIGLRSTQGGVKEAVMLRTIGPIMNSRLIGEDDSRSTCDPGQLAMEFTVPDLNSTGYIEYACSDADGGDDSLMPGDGIVVHNWANDVRRCAIVQPGGLFRISFPSDFQDKLVVTIYDGSAGDPFVDFEECEPTDGDAEKRTIETWEKYTEFQYWRWSEGEPLVSPAEGYGHIKGSGTLRAFLAIAQMILEPGDPINYAPHYFVDPLPSSEPGFLDHRVHSIVIGTVGDMNVPVNTAAAQGRAAGILGFESVDGRYGGRSQNQVALDNYVIEANERYGRSMPDDYSGICDDEPCHVLFDMDDIDRGTDGKNVPYLEDPMRSWVPSVAGEYNPDACTPASALPEDVDVDPSMFWCADDCVMQRCGQCYLWSSTEGERDFLEKVYCPGGVSTYIMPYIDADGTHGFNIPTPEQPFDENTFMIQAIGLHFATAGKVFSWQMCQRIQSIEENRDEMCPWIDTLPVED